MKRALLLTFIIIFIVTGVLGVLFVATNYEKAKKTASSSSAVTTTAPTTAPLNISAISLKAEKSTLEHGETTRVAAEITPSNAQNNVVKYKSSDNKIATVDDTGKVTGITAGTCDITAYADNNEKIANQVQIEVTDKRLEQINILNNYLAEIPSTQTVAYSGGNEKATVTLTSCKILDINKDNNYEMFIKYNLKEGINVVDVVVVSNKKAVSKHTYQSFKTVLEKNYGSYNEDVYTDYEGKIYIKSIEETSGLRKTYQTTTIYHISADSATKVLSLTGGQVRDDAWFSIPVIDDAGYKINDKDCTEAEYNAKLSEVKSTYTLFDSYVNRTLNLEVSAFEKVVPVVDLESGYTDRISWSSDKPKTASVNSSGIVTGISKGKCEVKGTLDVFQNSIAYSFVSITDQNALLDNYLDENKDKPIKSSDGAVMTMYASMLADIDNDGTEEMLLYYTGNGACQLDIAKINGSKVKKTTGFYDNTGSASICSLDIYNDTTTNILKLCENYTETKDDEKTISISFNEYESGEFTRTSSRYKIVVDDNSEQTYYLNDNKVEEGTFEQSISKYEKYGSWQPVNSNNE